MHLKSIHLINFKNYEEAEIALSSNVNCFVGMNGSGKTNILDAVHYLSLCKSYMNVLDRQNIRFDQQFFAIQGIWDKDQQEIAIHCAVKAGAKKVFKRNKKEYEKLADHIGQFPAVMISPYDRDLISEGSELRRKWMDGIISQFDRHYLDDIQKYGKILDQRNALLKNMYEQRLFDRESIEVWNDQMSRIGTAIHLKRKQFLEEFIPVFQERYNYIGLEEEEVHLEYRSQLSEMSFDDLLKAFEKKDAITHYSNGGTHKDDLLFEINNYPLKRMGSQGQQKSFIIALKLAQYEYLYNKTGIKPLLLLDDIFEKLDNNRLAIILTMIAEDNFGQIFISDTDKKRLEAMFKNLTTEIKYFEINKSWHQSDRFLESRLQDK
jgi:DNA replication and repair protein RecF